MNIFVILFTYNACEHWVSSDYWLVEKIILWLKDTILLTLARVRRHDSTFHLRTGRSVFQIAGNHFFEYNCFLKRYNRGERERRHATAASLCHFPSSSSLGPVLITRGCIRVREKMKRIPENEWKKGLSSTELSRRLDVTNNGCVEKGNDGPYNAVLINEATLSVRVCTSLFLLLPVHSSRHSSRARRREVPVNHATIILLLFTEKIEFCK